MKIDVLQSVAFMFVALCLAMWLPPCSAEQSVQDLPAPPAPAVIAKSLSAVEAVFGAASQRAKLPRDRAALAREVFGSRTSASNSSEYYAIVIYALDLAARGDDPVLVPTIADDLSRKYRVQAADLVAPRLGTVTGIGDAKSWPALATRLEEMIDDAVERESLEVAEELINATASLARKAKDGRTAATLAELRKTVDRRRRDAAKLDDLLARQKAGTAGPEELTALGELLCYQRAHWAAGLPHLAAGEDAAAAKAAKLELAARTSDEWVAAAAAWALVADSHTLPTSTVIRRHAQDIMQPALAAAAGLAKVQVQKEIEALDDKIAAAEMTAPNARKWTVLFRSADPALWNTAINRGANDFAIPVAHAPDAMRFLRMSAAGKAVIVPLLKPQLALESDCGEVMWIGTSAVLGKARLLGIASKDIVDCTGRTTGIVIRNPGANKAQFGFGFGGQIGRDTRQGYSWNGTETPPMAIEIAVTAGPLDAREKRLLVGGGP